MNRLMLVGLSAIFMASTANAQFVPNTFDLSSGSNTYYSNIFLESLNNSNWTTTIDGLTPNSGSQFLASANGNQNHDFPDIGLAKNLGGTIQNQPYTVSFYIAKYYGLGVQFSDFSTLRIGGPTGSMVWTDTPSPVASNTWYKWTGTYVPAPSDIGTNFIFNAKFTLRSQSSIAIDGLIQVPEPPALVLVAAISCSAPFARRRRQPPTL